LTAIEEFSTFDTGNVIFSCGSFTSIASSLPPNASVGRYAAVGTGEKIMGFRHPIEAVSINSAVFNFSRENISSYNNLLVVINLLEDSVFL
jgi:hypothetical protein